VYILLQPDTEHLCRRRFSCSFADVRATILGRLSQGHDDEETQNGDPADDPQGLFGSSEGGVSGACTGFGRGHHFFCRLSMSKGLQLTGKLGHLCGFTNSLKTEGKNK